MPRLIAGDCAKGALLAGLCASAAGAADGGITLVQAVTSATGVTCGASPDASYALAFSGPVTPGDTVVVYGFWALSPPAQADLADSLGNAYVALDAGVNPNVDGVLQNSVAQFFYAVAVDGGTDVVTLNVAPGFSQPIGLSLFEYSGISGVRPLDAEATAFAPDASTTASASLSTATDGDVLLAGVLDVNGEGNMVPAMGWTNVGSTFCFYTMVEQSFASDAGTYVASATVAMSDQFWLVNAAAFRPASADVADAGPADAGPGDSGAPDAAFSDAGATDAGTSDAATAPDAGLGARSSFTIGCQGAPGAGALTVLAGALWALALRRRRLTTR